MAEKPIDKPPPRPPTFKAVRERVLSLLSEHGAREVLLIVRTEDRTRRVVVDTEYRNAGTAAIIVNQLLDGCASGSLIAGHGAAKQSHHSVLGETEEEAERRVQDDDDGEEV